MNTFFYNFLRNSSIGKEFYKLDFIRQIYVASSCILLVNRSDHNLVSKNQLILYPDRHLVIRVNEAKRFKIHIII